MVYFLGILRHGPSSGVTLMLVESELVCVLSVPSLISLGTSSVEEEEIQQWHKASDHWLWRLCMLNSGSENHREQEVDWAEADVEKDRSSVALHG